MSEDEKIEEGIRLSGELPSGWTKSPLAEVAEIIMGQSPSSEYYNVEGDGLPFFQGKAEFGDLYPKAVKVVFQKWILYIYSLKPMIGFF